ncbi:MAG: UDP-N-acetylmuramate dehydrogenase [Gammaproteobacteria bacterium]|nr:UDP-N-acetylmuramate dehydrogenase [Gammaproteobacteria bacterium]
MAIQHGIRGQLLSNEPMSKHCSWRTGGVAETYFMPADKQDLQTFLAQTSAELPVYWIGLGSNLLVRDGGLKGVVIGALNRLNKLQLLPQELVYAEAGVSCAKLTRFCQQHNLDGAEFLAGIPGTVGGALAMNAGAFGSETWQFVESVEMMDRQGNLFEREAASFAVSYRSVDLAKDEWFSAGVFSFPIKLNDKPSVIKPLLAKRNSSQPIGLPSCGSVFKNPEGDYAARLIEACGLKGFCIGGACVSEKHANFIINDDQASASDIEKLIGYIQREVSEKHHIQLQTEVRIIGEKL